MLGRALGRLRFLAPGICLPKSLSGFHQADGKKYLYRTSVRRHDCIRKASRSFLDRVFGGQAAPALLHLVKTSKLSAEEVAQLRELLDDKELNSK